MIVRPSSRFVTRHTSAHELPGLNVSPDLPPLKWSSLKYVFRMEDKIDGKEEAYG